MATDVYASSRRSNDHSPMLSEEDLGPSTVLEGNPSGESRCFFATARALPILHFSTVLLRHESQDSSDSLTRGDRTATLRYWCYGLHSFLVVIHIGLVGMLFTHPEHRFSVSVNNTTATIALKAFLQAFYLVRSRAF